jgi:hypothetical protein
MYVRSGQVIVSVADYSNVQFIAYGLSDLVRYGDIIEANLADEKYTFPMRVSSTVAVTGQGNAPGYVVMPTDPEGLWAVLEESGVTRSPMRMTGLNFRAGVTVHEIIGAVIVPRNAVINESPRQCVYVFENGNLIKRYVITGITSGSEIQIVSGLVPGEWIAVGSR